MYEATEQHIYIGNAGQKPSLDTYHATEQNFYPTTIKQPPTAPSGTSLGQIKQVLDKWSITFSAGVQQGKASWQACRGIADTGCDGNWIRRDVLRRSGMDGWARQFDGPHTAMVDASDILHVVEEVITLIWYRNEEVETTMTEFFILDSGPYEMLLGREFVYKRLELAFGEEYARENLEDETQPKTILPGRLRPMTKGM